MNSERRLGGGRRDSADVLTGTARPPDLELRYGDGAEQAMIELVGSELVKRAADRAKRREERLKAQREGREPEEEEKEE